MEKLGRARLGDDICPSQISYSGLLAVLKLLPFESFSVAARYFAGSAAIATSSTISETGLIDTVNGASSPKDFVTSRESSGVNARVIEKDMNNRTRTGTRLLEKPGIGPNSSLSMCA
jgi:hypothetical protein